MLGYKTMERLLETIETKYAWVPEYKLVCDWAELALNEGTEAIEVIDYVARNLFKKAGKDN